jgi:hypothetical protein
MKNAKNQMQKSIDKLQESDHDWKIDKSKDRPYKEDERKFHYRQKIKYEISITFRDTDQYICHNNTIKKDLEEGLDFKWDKWKRLREHQKWFEKDYLPLLQAVCEYSLYQELSDPQVLDDHKWPRIHYHGTILFPNKESVMMFKLMTAYDIGQHGRVQINNYRKNYWKGYITKDVKFIKKLYNDNGLKYHFNYPSNKKDFFK